MGANPKPYVDGREALTPEQRALCDYMSDLSEEAFFAGWMTGLEHALWGIAQGTMVEYGWAEITPDVGPKLLALSAACGGWIVWDSDGDGETFVPIERWRAMYDAELAS